MAELVGAPRAGLPTQFGHYAVVEHLATGGMAEVYIARHTGMAGFERLVIIKRLRADLVNDHQATASLLDEARLVAALHHPNIAQVYEIGRIDDSYFLAMEYVPGRDLRHVMARAVATGYRVSIADAIYIAIQICVGLHYAHERRDAGGRPLGIIHRDVTPSNVLISHEGSIKICDFGIAKATTRSNQTVTRTLKGKYGYMSPEQCKCLPLDRRSDVFSLGIVLYELSTLTRAFSGPNELALLRQIVAGPPPLPSTRVADYPAALERIVMRALAHDRAARYATVQELQLALEALVREYRLEASPINIARLMTDLFGGVPSAGDDAGDAVAPVDGPEQPAPRGSDAELGWAAAAAMPTSAPARGVPDMFWALMGSPAVPAASSGLASSGLATSGLVPRAAAPAVTPSGSVQRALMPVIALSEAARIAASAAHPEAADEAARIAASAAHPAAARIAASAARPAVGPEAARIAASAAPPEVSPSRIARRAPPSVLWLIAAVVAGLVAGGAWLTGAAIERTAAVAAAGVLRADAAQIAAALELSHRLARVRAAGIATMPILRAAIETDAATVRDIAERDAVFLIGKEEALGVFQRRGEDMLALLQVPVSTVAVAPLRGGAARIADVGGALTVHAGASIERATASPDVPTPVGEVVVATRVELASATRGLAQHTRWAALRGPGVDVQLVGLAGGAPAIITTVSLPTTGELGATALVLVAVPNAVAPPWLAPVPGAGSLAAVLALLWYACQWWRTRAASARSANHAAA